MSIVSLQVANPGDSRKLLPLIEEFNEADGIVTAPSRIIKVLERLGDNNHREIKVYEKQGFESNPRAATLKILADSRR